MGGSTIERLRWKEPLHSLEVELQRDYGLSVVASRALVRRLEALLDTHAGGAASPGQLRYTAVAIGEKAGVMTVAGLAELLHTSPGTMSKDLRELAIAVHLEAPPKGLIEDADATLTHKDWILELDQCGLTGEEMAWLTRHAPASRDRYIATLRSAEALARIEGRIPDADHLASLLRLRRHVAQQYLDLLERHHGQCKVTEEIAQTPACSEAPRRSSHSRSTHMPSHDLPGPGRRTRASAWTGASSSEPGSRSSPPSRLERGAAEDRGTPPPARPPGKRMDPSHRPCSVACSLPEGHDRSRPARLPGVGHDLGGYALIEWNTCSLRRRRRRGPLAGRTQP